MALMVMEALLGAGLVLLRLVENDASKLRATGWAPRWTFEDGLAATVTWYRKHEDWWQAVKSGAYRDYYTRMYGDRLRTATP